MGFGPYPACNSFAHYGLRYDRLNLAAKQASLMRSLDSIIEAVVDGGYLPWFVLRRGIRAQLKQRIHMIERTSLAASYETKMTYVDLLRKRPIAVETAAANEQHYEVGTGVLSACLGPRMKYSSCFYPKGTETLAQAEIAMLESYVEKAQLKDGMKIFDLG